MSKKVLVVFSLILIFIAGFILFTKQKEIINSKSVSIAPVQNKENLNPLTITAMRERSYPGSNITIEKILPDAANYHQYLTSYVSDGLKIYALLTIPTGQKPKNGWPVIIFNHGYITPQDYQTFPSVGQYASYYPVFSSAGYIVFKPDFRGNGISEGQPEGAYYSTAYTVDDLNALASIKRLKISSVSLGQLADPNRIGIWGHSMGGNITLRDLVVDTNDIKAAVIWGGVVGSYMDLEHWHDPSYHPSAYELSLRYRYRADLEKQYGTPETNPDFWNSIDPTHFVKDINTPIQLDVGLADEEVPVNFSTSLRDKLQNVGKTVDYFAYPGANHNISQSFNIAMQNSLEFFNKYLKGGE